MAELLLVGPQSAALTQLTRALAGAQPGWLVRHMISETAALEQLARRAATVVLAHLEPPNPPAEQHKPDPATANFERFFAAVAERCPDAIRLALCRQQGPVPIRVLGAHQCLALRDDVSQLPGLVAAAVHVAERIAKQPSLKHIIGRLRDVPTPPTLYFDIREQIQARGGNVAAMASIAARDPSLVARILKLVNSGFYGVPRSVRDLSDAIGLIGTDTLLGLVLAAQLYAGLPPPGLNLDKLWQHTTRVANLARLIAQREGGDRNEQSASAVAGLLHDIGLMVLLANEAARYQPLWQKSHGDENRLAELERDTFGFTHSDLGAVILTLWTLPNDIVEAVETSHFPGPGPLSLPSRAVLAAEWLLNTHDGIEEPAPPALVSVPAAALDQWRVIRHDLLAGARA